MAVLVEATSIIIRMDILQKKFNYDWDSFCRIVPNNTLCADTELARVGFMDPNDVESFARMLEQHGLIHQDDNGAVDFVVVDMLRGPIQHCSWVEYGHVSLDDSKRVAVCRLVGSQSKQFISPANWVFEESLTANHNFVPTAEINSRLSYKGTDGHGTDIYQDSILGTKVYTGRATKKNSKLVDDMTSHDEVQKYLREKSEKMISYLIVDEHLSGKWMAQGLAIAPNNNDYRCKAWVTALSTILPLLRRAIVESSIGRFNLHDANDSAWLGIFTRTTNIHNYFLKNFLKEKPFANWVDDGYVFRWRARHYEAYAGRHKANLSLKEAFVASFCAQLAFSHLDEPAVLCPEVMKVDVASVLFDNYVEGIRAELGRFVLEDTN